MRFTLVLACAAVLHADGFLIRNATVCDGSGQPCRLSDVRVEGDSITALGRITPSASEKIVEARGMVLAPGFIDIHNHSDRGLESDPLATSQIAQGITTAVLGPDGGSPWPVGEAIAARAKSRAALNTLYFAGHATIRRRVLGEKLDRAATSAEIAAMSKLLEQAMREGAAGLSTGLEYDPALHSTTEEVIALARVAARHGGIYMSHIRDEGNKFFAALEEAIRIGREAGIAVQISHLKLGTTPVWGQTAKVLDRIRRARHEGIDITADVYPYDAWSSTIAVLVPSRRHDDMEEVRRGIAEVGGADRIRITSCSLHRDWEGKTLAGIAASQGRSAEEIYRQIIRDGGASVVCRSMEEKDVAQLLAAPWVMIASDGGIGMRHPRGSGTFPRVLGRYVRDERIFPIEEAIRKMTALPAARLSLADRGRVASGFKADLVLFDPAKITDRSTFDEPFLLPDGIRSVWVNGVEVVAGGKPTGARPGLSLRRSTPSDSAETMLRRLMTEHRIPGLAAAVLRDGKVVREFTLGPANLEWNNPVTADTIFQSGSLGKMFTSAAVVMLAREGKLSLDDTMPKFFPGAPATWQNITVRHLLSHTSGIPNYTNSLLNFRQDYTEDQLITFAQSLKPDFAPGSRWSYSNTGYVVLGALIRKVTGHFYGDILRERIFTPAGMESARIIDESSVIPFRAAGYALRNGRVENQSWVSPVLNTTADGSLYLTLRDWEKWDAALYSMDEETKRLFWTPVLSNYGLGWFVSPRLGRTCHWHGGSWQGFQTFFERFPEQRLSVVVLTNSGAADPAPIADALAAHFLK